MKFPFVGGSYEGRSKDVNAQKCKNLYPVVNQQGGKEVLSLQHTPGLKLTFNLQPTCYFVVTDAGGSFFSASGTDYFLVFCS